MEIRYFIILFRRNIDIFCLKAFIRKNVKDKTVINFIC